MMVDMSFGRAMTTLAGRDPGAPAVTCAGRTVSRAELEAASNRRARALAARGVVPGDMVVLALPNSVEYFENALALWKLGATPVLVSHRLPAVELTGIVELAAPRLVIGSEAPQADGPADAALSGAPLPDVVTASWKAPCSGGSTGRPKLILEATPGLIDPDAAQGFGIEPGGIQLVTAPLHHNAPFGYATRGLLTGQHVVVMPAFDPVEMLALVDRHRVQWTMVVPTMMNRVSRLTDEQRSAFDVSSLTSVWHMAAPCPAWLKQKWIDWLGPDVVWELYGSSEQIAATVISGREWLERPGSVGRPVFGEVRICGGDGAELPVGEVGEIFLRSPQGTRSFHYVGAEERRTHDGWTSVGDLGHRDADGFLYLSDRRVDLIISGGANIYPAEVEAAVESHPDVLEAVVVGLADDDLGQRVHAIVRVAPGQSLGSEDLLAHLTQRLVRYKIPRTVEFVHTPLRDEAGKVRRSALRAERQNL